MRSGVLAARGGASARSRRPRGALLALYGGVLVVAGGLVLADAIDPSEPVDEHALRWHVLVWDMWFLLWGAAPTLAGRRLRPASPSRPSSRHRDALARR